MADNKPSRCIYLFGLPLSLTEECARDWQRARTARTDSRQAGQTDRVESRTNRTDSRQEGRTDRTSLRCADGSCGAEATIGSFGDAVGNALSGLSAGAVGPLPYLLGGAAVLVAGAYVYSSTRGKQ